MNCARCTVRGRNKKVELVPIISRSEQRAYTTCWDWAPRDVFPNQEDANIFFSRELDYPELYKQKT
jgi:hypothetical protein